MSLRDAAAYGHLPATGAVSVQLIKWVSSPGPFTGTESEYPSSTNFEVMAMHTASHQISTAAVLTVHRRASDAALGGAVSPEGLLALSRTKVGAVSPPTQSRPGVREESR
ncbi:hypothetical protein MBT84_46580 [Streptomyces sp. MBT84]|uniref:Uncharacterized protein n=1 Tax=Streptomyces lannensis TaxID=766498 RepID=A0ABP7LEM4_9ACTN|nr:hypothetical protein [Streptomyces sp. MBT84]